MSQTDMDNLMKVTDVLAQAAQAQLRDIAETERTLRSSLAKLDEDTKAAQSFPQDKVAAMRQIGADVVWQSWAGRMRSDLNRQLALCLARKADILRRVRTASGRQMAVEAIKTSEEREKQSARNERETADIQAMCLNQTLLR